MNQEMIGQFIKQCRKEKGMTQEQLATRLNISYKTVSKWECGNGMPEVSLMLPLCRELDISVNELLSGCKIEEKDYREKAEQNLISVIRERRENKKKILTAVAVACSTLLPGLLLCVLAKSLDMHAHLRILLIATGVIVVVAGVAICCVLDRDAGYYQCPRCKNRFVPSMAAYVAGPHTLLRRQLKCPACGKISYCKKKLSR